MSTLFLESFEGLSQRQTSGIHRVQAHLEQEFLKNENKEGFQLPPISTLAAQLGVGESSVRTVYKYLAAKGLTAGTRGKGTFLQKAVSVPKQPLKVGSNLLDFCKSEGLGWAESIYMGAVREAMEVDREVFLKPARIVSEVKDRRKEVANTLIASVKELDALFLYPSPYNDAVRETYLRHKKLIVDINPPRPNITTNFVSPDYYEWTHRLGNTWRKTGRKRALVILLGSPFSASAAASQQLLLSGFSDGWQEGGADDSCSLDVEIADGPEVENGISCMEKYLATHTTPPDAVFCAGDYIGLGAIQVLRAAGFSVPREVSIVAGTGLDETAWKEPGFTLMLQPFCEMGSEIIRMLCWRATHGGADHAGRFLKCGIAGGKTTLPAENELLGLKPA